MEPWQSSVGLGGALSVIADNLMHRSVLEARMARARLAFALRPLRLVSVVDRTGDRSPLRRLSLVSITLDELSGHVKTACEIALGPDADLDDSRAHALLADLRATLQSDASELMEGSVALDAFFPEIEARADRALRIMQDVVERAAVERDSQVVAIREQMH
jgi:hypothetical protein